uniref:Cytochrome b-c1 complex subunit 2, mitochondrial n=2 Tax=Lepeophtheirus salmonis TaxID=72036 RepID=D3PGV5_LEPSM|nr:Cytochrome b-c1 complex subunit 2, mitochondrial [Lepeophtheirus salmonis]
MKMASTFRIVRGFATSKEGVTKLPNGLSVLSVPECTGVGYLRMSVLGGSRYERYENLGSSHALRSGGGLSTHSHSYFGITRGIQQSGANFDISQGREIMSYSLTSSRKTIPSLSDMFIESVTNPAFKNWEVSDVCPGRIKNDLSNLSPAYMAQELLYKAAFRTGIGNSIYSPSFMVGSHNSAMLKGFFDKTFALDRATLIGCGISHESLLQIAECINLPSASTTKTTASTFYGGECRSELNGQHAHIAMGFPGSSYASSEKERISALLYLRILGVGSRVKRGVGLGRLNKVLEGNVATSTISFTHQDAALFGVYIACADHSLAGESLRKVIQVFKNPKITDAEVKAAKKNVIADLSEAYLNPSSLCNILEEQILLGGGKIQDNSKAVEDSINSVTIADVQTFAKKISGSPLSMGAIGNLEHLPYLDEL